MPQKIGGLEIAAIYLQPVEMEPPGMVKKVSESDIHLEADIHALTNNPNGFEEGAWVPYLSIKFEIGLLSAGYLGSLWLTIQLVQHSALWSTTNIVKNGFPASPCYCRSA